MAKKKSPTLKLERVDSQANFFFLSLIEYKRETYLCIIDTIKDDEIGAYVLDYADQSKIDLPLFLQAATRWFYSKSDVHPLSMELSRLGMTEWAAPMYRTFDTTYVSRIIGNGFSYQALDTSKVKRRRVIPLPEGIEIRLKKTE